MGDAARQGEGGMAKDQEEEEEEDEEEDEATGVWQSAAQKIKTSSSLIGIALTGP
jgi:hypothetical protein